MKINNTKEPVSSFLSVEKDAGLIMDRIFANKNLKKLLYYNTPDALYREALTEEQMQSLIDNNIKFVPKIKVDKLVDNITVKVTALDELFNVVGSVTGKFARITDIVVDNVALLVEKIFRGKGE